MTGEIKDPRIGRYYSIVFPYGSVLKNARVRFRTYLNGRISGYGIFHYKRVHPAKCLTLSAHVPEGAKFFPSKGRV